MSKKSEKLPETLEGTILFNVPFPEDLAALGEMAPTIIKQHHEIDYLHTFGQDSPFFAGLANKQLLGTECPECGYRYATPKGHCIYCGIKTEWVEMPHRGRVHTWTTCYFGGEEFLKETPFNLILVEFDGFDTLLLARLVGVGPEEINVGMEVEAKFKRNSKFKPTDVYFVPIEKP
ncbi:MAG: Zn-ribbon domain-containing OB-fold protein [Candidatus Bipolaricaulia bacterium]